MRFTRYLSLVFLWSAVSAAYVEFSFEVGHSDLNPFQRDFRAAIVDPSNEVRWYPAFYDGDSVWKVRVRPDQPGGYLIDGVAEWVGSDRGEVEASLREPVTVVADSSDALSPIGIDPGNRLGFRREDGSVYLPLGMNIAWGGDGFFETAFPALRAAGLNWGRIWMTHWDGTDLDWDNRGPSASPVPGMLNLEVARKWDRIVELAELNGVAFQMVLQHHGQFSTEVNPNWQNNPWNLANGGFLENPSDFFTSDEARRLTRWKYRFIVARYGHSPSILAWELFNEVFGTDALRLEGDEDAVAAWHDEMAAWIRSVDTHGHLVTTSHDHLDSPIYASMDYYQPHLYGLNMLAHVRRFPEAPDPLDKPLFYGEVGDTSMLFPAAEDLHSGVGLIPHLWTGLMADEALPAQAWFWDRLLGTPRMAELASLSAFLRTTGMTGKWQAFRAFQPSVECEARVPAVITAGMNWSPRAVLEWEVDESGRDDEALADVPYYVVRDPALVEGGFPDRLILKTNWAEPRLLRVDLDDVGSEGLTLLVMLGDRVVRDLTWPPYEKAVRSELRPASFEVEVPPGEQVMTLRNFGPDTFRLRQIDLDGELPALAAIGKRSGDEVVLYLWHRSQVHSAERPEEISGTVLVEDLAAGEWEITWWDMEAGTVGSTARADHPGGLFRLETPVLSRHAAVILHRRQ